MLKQRIIPKFLVSGGRLVKGVGFHGNMRLAGNPVSTARVYDAYGPTRMFWGSDLSRLPCSYTLCVTMFTEEMPWLKGEELEQVMGKAVCKWFGWDLKV